MATFIALHDASDNSEVIVNADHIVSVRRTPDDRFSTVFFAHTSFGVTETGKDIAKKARDAL